MWSDEGCEFVGQSSDGVVSCRCNHLTDFSAGSGETYDTLARVFARNNLDQLFTVHWYVVFIIVSILIVFIIAALYGHHYDNRVVRRTGLEAAMLASIFANKIYVD